MKKYLRFTFLTPVAYSLVSAVLTGLFLAAAAAAYLPAGGTGVLSAFLFRYGYPLVAVFGAAAAASPFSFTLCLWLSRRHRREALKEGRIYRNAPLALSLTTQGILLAALLFFVISNLC